MNRTIAHHRAVSDDKKKHVRALDRLTVPPRLEGKAKNAGMYSSRKKKKNGLSVPSS